eukprot:9467024-Pyramimonas_sp.AAC.1
MGMVLAGIHLDHHPGEYAKRLAQINRIILLELFDDRAPLGDGNEKEEQGGEEGQERTREKKRCHHSVDRAPQKTEGLDDEIFVNAGAAR